MRRGTHFERPGWGRHLLLLWGLRATLARGTLTQRSVAISTLGGAVATAVAAVVAARGSHALFLSAAVHDSAQLALFLSLLLGFLASTLWITWPVVTASVDDAAELSRFALFPVAPQRLFLASVLAGLVEPRTLPIWGALLGASAGLILPEEGNIVWGLLSTVLMAAFCVVWGRVGLHLLLNLFRQRRSAEAMGGGLLLFLGCAAFVPPPDLGWLRGLKAASPTLNDAFLRGSIATFTLLPTGGWAWTVVAAAREATEEIPLPLAYLTCGTLVGYLAAFRLLLRFHRGSARALPQRVASERARSSFAAPSLDAVLVEREWRDLLLNARARLTVALPFFLTILLKLVGARALAREVLGAQCDVWLAGGVASYGALVLAGGFAQNCFGSDGSGAQLFLGAPVSIRQVLRAKNIVHGGIAILLGGLLVGFYALYIAQPPLWSVFAIVCNTVWQALLLVSLGNILSIIAPRKFHPSLKRRDRASALSVALGLAGASVAVAPGTTILRHVGNAAPSVGLLAIFPTLMAVGAVLWLLSIREAEELLRTRRASLLRAVVRE
jgi:ABC-2 type transport system permease protein